MTKPQLCLFLSPWLEKFITEYILRKNFLKDRWIISIDDVIPVNLSPSKYMEVLKDEPDYNTMRGGSKFIDDTKIMHILE